MQACQAGFAHRWQAKHYQNGIQRQFSSRRTMQENFRFPTGTR